MLRNAHTIRGYKVLAAEGEIGEVHDLYFDDQTWKVRYFDLRTGTWFNKKQVLVTPSRVERVDADEKALITRLAQDEIRACTPTDCEQPLSARAELVLPSSDDFWPPSFRPDEELARGEVHLRSMRELERYYIAATDGDIGRVADFVVDDADWAIRYLVVDTRVLLPGKHVLLSPEWIEEADWGAERVRVNLERAAVKDAPEYDHKAPVSREYESDLCHFYNREGYWERECSE